MKSLITKLVLLSCLVPAITIAVEKKEVPKSTVDPSLQQFLQALIKAVDARDMTYIHSKISKTFMLYRDFGGMYDNKRSHIQNFHGAFELDNTKLFPEYKDHGWKKLKEALEIHTFESSSFAKAETCGPKGAMDKKPYPYPQICFKKQKDGGWLISSYIFGGD